MQWRLWLVTGILMVGVIFLAGCAAPGEAVAPPTPTLAASPVAQPKVAGTVIPSTATATPAPSATPMPTATPLPTATATVAPTPTIPPLRSRIRPRASDRVTQVTPGVVWISRETRDPLKINILVMDLTALELDIRVGLASSWLSGIARTSQMAQAAGAVAAVNGDLFNQFTLPEGMTIVDGRVAIAPKKRATFAWDKERKPFIGYFTNKWTWDAEVQTPGGVRTPLHLLNWPCPDDMLCLYNDLGRFAPYRSGGYKALLGPDGRVTGFAGEARWQVPQGGHILQGTGQAARWLQANAKVGDRLEMTMRTDPPLSDFRQALSGGPIIVQDGRFVEDCLCVLDECAAAEASGYLCEDLSLEYKRTHYRQVYMPRTGVGFDKDGHTLIAIVTDGYQPGFSRGAQQRELAQLFLEFGAHTAMELDGGGSSTMVVRNKVVNNPSDNTGERHVANSLLFLWNERRAP